MGRGNVARIAGMYIGPLEGSRAFMVIAFEEIPGECLFALVA